MEKLYMIEVLVNSVVFDELPVPLKKNVVVHASCPIVGSIEISTDVMGALENLESKERSARKKDVDIDCGRSLLFLIDPKSLRDVLKKPLEVSVMTKNDTATPIGTALVPWDTAFQDMVENSIMSEGYVTPVGMEDVCDMHRDGQHSAKMSMFIRLSFLGRSVYTNIQKLGSKEEAHGDSGAPGGPAFGAPVTYLVKSVDNATVFECKRYGVGSDSDFVPIGALYNAANRGAPVGAGRAQQSIGSTRSTATIMTMKAGASTTSMTPSVFFGMGAYDRTAMIQNVLSTADSRIPLRSTRGKEDKFLDLTELHMDVSTFSMLANAMGMHIYQRSGSIGEGEEEGEGGIHPMFVDYKSLTVEEIERRLCKHPDCPAAKLFKEFGIGPLAKNISGLGGLYDDVQAPCAYGLSHCNGTIDDYGPLGRFKRPKKAEEPFVPQSDCKCARKSSTVSTTSTGSNTLSKGSKGKAKGKSECYQHCPMNPLRLKGGAPTGPPCDPMPNPITLCQDLMEEFNKVLKDYKDALGPCGKATCPFALSLVDDACAEICNSTDPEYRKRICELTDPEAVLEEKDEFTGCGVPNCPYKRAAISPAERDFSKFRGMPGCGYAKCPFVKAKLGMEPEEDEHLPPFKDYEKQETYKYADDLPPIHWDCPDPLPKGDCRNPDCPFVKRDALIKKYFPEPCCPCGSPACPYVCAPCTFPGCPFGIAEPCPPVCPYTEPPPKELKCTPSVCPFVRNTETRCENPACPYKIYEDKLAECAQWERQQALLAEMAAEEEEEDDEPCKPCGRGKSKRARCSKGNSMSMSMSRIESVSKTSDMVDAGVERASDPCILSAAMAEKRDPKNVPCKPGTCGVGENVCGVCKRDKGERAERIKDQTQGEIKVKPDVGDKATDASVRKEKESKVIFHSRGSKDSNDRNGSRLGIGGSGILKKPIEEVKKKAVNKAKQPKRKRVGGKTTTKAAMGPIVPRPVINTKRPFPFRIDRRTYKPSKMIGHGDCVLPKFLVPKRMGWLWNIHENICGLRPRKGWKPGAVSKMIAFRMDYYKALANRGTLQKKQKVNIMDVKPSQPTVQINKKGGVVNVTMHPIKEPAEINKVGDGNPYIDCSPIQFKVMKNEKDKEIKYCYCGDQLSDTESSELDIEFSPPGALKNPRLMRKHQLFDQEVQYNIEDVPLPPRKSKKGKGKGAKGKGKKGKKGKGKKGGRRRRRRSRF